MERFSQSWGRGKHSDVSTTVVSQGQRPPWVWVSPPTAVQPRVSPKAVVMMFVDKSFPK